MKPRPKVFIISGPSGVGKTTIAKRILAEVEGIQKTVSSTTRRRRGEDESSDYRFITRKKFLKLVEEGAFLEWAQVLNNFYGTPREEVERILADGKDVLLCIDVQGAKQIRKKIPQAISIFILPPNLAALKRRLLKRGEASSQIARRLALAKKELQMLKNYDYWVVNDLLEKAVELVKYIIYAERLKVEDERIKEVLDVICKDR